MELVYYWINKDSCINEQGFCFSPEYSISMLKSKEGIYEVRLEKKKLSIFLHLKLFRILQFLWEIMDQESPRF